MGDYAVEERTAWRWWVTPKALHEKPVHRWFVFPHSFTSELVHALIDEWGLDRHDRILDPFVGAGTTLLAAKEKGVPATGYDLLPLSVLVANTKVANYSLLRLKREWEMLMATRKVRYQSIQSHPEAHPVRPETKEYRRPEKLKEVIEELNEVAKDIRIPTMIDGYFLDIYICLREMMRVCKSGARIALVVGNAQYYGLPLPVDEIIAELGEQIGLTCDKIVAVRYRGNSAQQMGKYGRNPSRESVIIFRKQ